MNNLNLDREIYKLLEDLGQRKSPNENIKIAIAIVLFISNSISLGRAASIAGLAKGDFMEILKNSNISWGEYDELAIQLDDSFLKDIQ